MFNKRNQMHWNSYYMIPFILTFKNRQLIDGDESQISGYQWGEGTPGVLFLDLNNGYTL